MMFSIEDYGLDYYIPAHCREEYKKVAYSSLPIEEKIVQLLTVNPGFMAKSSVLSDEEKYKKFKYKNSVDLIKKKVTENKKLEFFAQSFVAKPHIIEITNGLVYPDASELLLLIHLNLVFKYINEIYHPGAVLRIGSQFIYFKKFNSISQEQAEEMTSIIHKLNLFARKMSGSGDYIQIYDVYEHIEPVKKEFFIKVEKAKFKILQKDIDMTDIKNGADYLWNYVIDVGSFPNKEAAWNFCMYHTLDAAAYNIAINAMFNTPYGLFERYNELVQGETRFQSGSTYQDNPKSVYISFLPGASTFSFNKLTLRRDDGYWELASYKQIKEMKAQENFIKELRYPFFFKEIKNGKSL